VIILGSDLEYNKGERDVSSIPTIHVGNRGAIPLVRTIYTESPDEIISLITPLSRCSDHYLVKKTPNVIRRYKYFGTEMGAILLKISSEVVGYVIFFVGKNHLYMLKIAVDEKWRRRGFGKLLMKEFEKKAKEKGKIKIKWRSDIDDHVANSFYISLGFKNRRKLNKKKYEYEVIINEVQGIEKFLK